MYIPLLILSDILYSFAYSIKYCTFLFSFCQILYIPLLRYCTFLCSFCQILYIHLFILSDIVHSSEHSFRYCILLCLFYQILYIHLFILSDIVHSSAHSINCTPLFSFCQTLYFPQRYSASDHLVSDRMDNVWLIANV